MWWMPKISRQKGQKLRDNWAKIEIKTKEKIMLKNLID